MRATTSQSEDGLAEVGRAARLRRARLLLWVLLLLPVTYGLLYPKAQNYLRATSLLARVEDPQATGWIADYEVHPVEVRDASFEFRGRSIPAYVYSPRGTEFAPGIVVVHGMHDRGIDEPRLVSFARALASSGFLVMTPLISGIVDYRVAAESADLIGRATQSFAHGLGVPRVGLMAVSFSGGLALLAASDPRYSASIGWVAALGAHYDLAHVLRFIATDEAVHPDGSVTHFPAHEYGALITICDSPADVFSQQGAATARAAIRLLLSGKVEASEAVTKQMSPADQEIMQRIYRKQRAGFAPIILAKIEKQKDLLEAGSPAGHLQSLQVPVLLLHGSDDTVIPASELLWLKRDIPEQYLLGALVSPGITHVGAGSKGSLREGLALVHWLSLLIREARNAPVAKLAKMPAGAWIMTSSATVQ